MIKPLFQYVLVSMYLKIITSKITYKLTSRLVIQFQLLTFKEGMCQFFLIIVFIYTCKWLSKINDLFHTFFLKTFKYKFFRICSICMDIFWWALNLIGSNLKEMINDSIWKTDFEEDLVYPKIIYIFKSKELLFPIYKHVTVTVARIPSFMIFKT